MGVDISIAVCTRNRRNLLVQALDSIDKLKVPDGLSYEVLVIDNGSTDGTWEVVQRFVEKAHDIYAYHSEPRKGLSIACNCAVERARGEIIAFVDDDVVVDEQWLQALRDVFVARPDIAAVQGKILLQEGTDPVPPWLAEEVIAIQPLYDRGPTRQYASALVGANMAVRKRIFEKYNLFNIHLGGGASGTYQDTELGRRLVQHGEKILYEPAAVVIHAYLPERMTQEYVWNRWRQIARSKAYVDVVLNGKKPSAIRNRLRLFRYSARRSWGRLTRNERTRHRYDRKIYYQKNYMAEVTRLSKTPPIGLDDQ